MCHSQRLRGREAPTNFENPARHASCSRPTMLKMKALVATFTALLLAASIAGCEKNEAAASPDTSRQASKAEEAKADAPSPTGVKVEKGGTKFDPPVKPSDIPDGAWMCDMGTVHFASLDKGSGKCPTCGMNLKKKGHEGHEGHEAH